MLAIPFLQAAYSCGQSSSDYLSLTVSTSPNFTLNTAALFESAQVISSVFKISVLTSSSDCTVYASIPSGITTSSVTPMAASNISLQYNNTDCPPGHINYSTTSALAMASSNTKLFAIKKWSKVSNWYYDIDIPALGYAYNPGTYSYTIQFTMTQP